MDINVLGRHQSSRFVLVLFSLIIALVIFVVKLTLIQAFRSEHLAKLAKQQQEHYIELEPVRGMIYDRRMRPLALNETVYSVYANPRSMSKADKIRAIESLPEILGLSRSYVQDRLNRNKFFVWIQRKVSSETHRKLKSENLKGISFIKESKRYYPNKNLAAHVIGFAGVDNNGLEGLELAYDKKLRGQPGWTTTLRDAHQRELLLESEFIAPQDGLDLVLTIDETIQFVAERALEKAFHKFHAKSASIIVMNPRTGEILALANYPTYDLSQWNKSTPEQRNNRAMTYVYEPGSVFKIVTASGALEEEIFQETDKIFCENGSFKVANHVLHDHVPHGLLTFQEVFEKSSNIGTMKVAQKLGPEKLYNYARRFGFGQKTGVELLGEVAGIIRPPSKWSKTSISAIPMGHEVTVTPLQMLTAMSTIANDGVRMKPHIIQSIKDQSDEIIEEFSPQEVDRIMSINTAHRIKEILNGVVERGTATKAKIEGVRVAGKTGTAQKVIDGQYSHSKFYATFVGFAPVEDPKLSVIVVLDEPRPSYFGGTVAAPVFKEVVENALKYMESYPNDFPPIPPPKEEQASAR